MGYSNKYKERAASLGMTPYQYRMSQFKSKEDHRLGKIADLLADSGIDLDELSKVNRVNIWQGFYKDAEGNAQVVDMAGIEAVPKWADGPAWPIVNQIQRYIIPPLPAKKTTGFKTACVLPDLQIGFRRNLVTGDLEPFHDESAISAAMAVVTEVKPDVIVCLGDGIDLPSFSSFSQEPGFALTTQPALERYGKLLADLRSIAKVIVFEGNHDYRLSKAIMKNAFAAFGLKRTNAPLEWPVLSVPFLCRFSEMDIEYIDGYPAGIWYFNDSLAAMHGYKINSSGSTAAKVVSDEEISLIFGHVHRIELQYRTRRIRTGAKEIFAATPGCLCSIIGDVPSYKSSVDLLGRPVPTAENWQQGMAVVTYDDKDFAEIELIHIKDGSAFYRGSRIFA